MRPGMYIGSTGSRGLHHLLWEIVDNAIDEVANGYATEHLRGAAQGRQRLRGTDNGRGIPVDIHPELGITGVEVDLHPAARGRQIRSSRIMRIPADCTASARQSSTR